MTRNEAVHFIVDHTIKDVCTLLSFKDDQGQQCILITEIKILANCMYVVIGLYDIGMVEIFDMEGWGDQLRQELTMFVEDYLNSNDFTQNVDDFKEV